MTDPAQMANEAGLDATQVDADPADDAEFRFDPERTIRSVAEMLVRLHQVAVPAGVVPELGPSDLVRRAGDAVASGWRPDADGPYGHVAPERLLQVLIDGSTVAEDRYRRVLTHGHPTIDRFRGRSGQLVGLVDWQAAAVSDPYRDLAAAAQGTAATLGPMLVPVLFDAYVAAAGTGAPDPHLVDWYALAAQFEP